MNIELMKLKDEFLMYLYDISKMKMVGYISTFIQGEDAFMLRLFMNGPMTPKDISNELKITKGRVTAIINKLKNKDYIKTSINEGDKRSLIAELSVTGKDYFQKKLNIADKYFNDVFNVLGVDDSRILVDQIANLLTKVKEAGL